MDTEQIKDAIIMITSMEQKNREQYPEWRHGQNLFNSLNMVYPEIAEGLRATDVDPFYDNTRYGKCWEQIIKVLKTDEQP